VRQRVLLLEGDGVSAELLPIVEQTLRALAPQLELEHAPFGLAEFERNGSALPAETLARARAADACFLVAITSPLEARPGYTSPIVALRRELDLFANTRPVVSAPAGSPVRGAGSGVDLVIVRENTECLYGGRETREHDAVLGRRARSERVITELASRRIARVAAQIAATRRGRVCVAHKSNVLRATCGLFRECALDELARFGGLAIDELLVDTAALALAEHPERFDVLVTTNLFGDILSDLAAHAGGGLGLVASSNLGESHALFEPVHGSAPDIAGRAVANPIASLRAAGFLLAHLARDEHESAAARALDAALDAALVQGPHTRDLGGSASTSDVAAAVLTRATAQLTAQHTTNLTTLANRRGTSPHADALTTTLP
jgi:homoisocitrate dehydrogenase